MRSSASRELIEGDQTCPIGKAEPCPHSGRAGITIITILVPGRRVNLDEINPSTIRVLKGLCFAWEDMAAQPCTQHSEMPSYQPCRNRAHQEMQAGSPSVSQSMRGGFD
jgi:hypothetical protein